MGISQPGNSPTRICKTRCIVVTHTSGADDRNNRQQSAGENHDYECWQDQVGAGNRSDGGKKFDVACAHRSENVQHEHQDEGESATTEARIET